MHLSTRNTKVFIYRKPVDMRKGHNGLSFMVTHEMGRNLLSGSIFLFVSKSKKSAKALIWDGTGLVLLHKKLEQGKFMSFHKLQEVQEITSGELALILEGSKLQLPLSKKAIEIDLKV